MASSSPGFKEVTVSPGKTVFPAILFIVFLTTSLTNVGIAGPDKRFLASL